MTLVLRKGNRYYADSKVMVDDQLLFCMDKIRPVKQPFQIICNKRKIDDFIHGYTFTGASDQVDALILQLKKNHDIDMAELMYRIVDECRMVNSQNHFEVILIGEKKDYAITVGQDQEFIRYHERTDELSWAMGSGRDIYQKTEKTYEGIDVIRAMWMTFLKEPSCGGIIDVWELFLTPFVHFRRIGMHNRISGQLVEQFSTLFSPTQLSLPVPMDLIVNPEVPPVKLPKEYAKEVVAAQIQAKLKRAKNKVDKLTAAKPPKDPPPAPTKTTRKRKKPNG